MEQAQEVLRVQSEREVWRSGLNWTGGATGRDRRLRHLAGDVTQRVGGLSG
jgi:hypothetical protein